MLLAIINQLKTGTITKVIAKGGASVNPPAPYVVVWEDTGTEQLKDRNIGGYFVSVHYPKGYILTLDEYIKNEVLTLLHEVLLTDSVGNKNRLLSTGQISPVIDTNDDGTISRDRLFTIGSIKGG
jgi:hypothetical protein